MVIKETARAPYDLENSRASDASLIDVRRKIVANLLDAPERRYRDRYGFRPQTDRASDVRHLRPDH